MSGEVGGCWRGEVVCGNMAMAPGGTPAGGTVTGGPGGPGGPGAEKIVSFQLSIASQIIAQRNQHTAQCTNCAPATGVLTSQLKRFKVKT